MSGRRLFHRPLVPPPPGHDFNEPDDPEPLRPELARLRHDEWKRTSVCDGQGAAEAACARLALLRGYEAGVISAPPSSATTARRRHRDE